MARLDRKQLVAEAEETSEVPEVGQSCWIEPVDSPVKPVVETVPIDKKKKKVENPS